MARKLEYYWPKAKNLSGGLVVSSTRRGEGMGVQPWVIEVS